MIHFGRLLQQQQKESIYKNSNPLSPPVGVGIIFGNNRITYNYQYNERKREVRGVMNQL